MMIQTSPAYLTSELEKQKEQGRAFLKSNQVDKALKVFAGILRENPEDIESMLILGDAYLIIGERLSALALYRQASDQMPDRRDIQRRVALLQSEEQADGSARILPTQPRAIAELIQRLTGQTMPVTEEEIHQASSLLEEYVRSESPAGAVAQHLNEIDSLLPALIELNIRQARMDGNKDLEESLQDLMANILLQIDLRTDGDHPGIQSENRGKNPLKILVCGVDSSEAPFRKVQIAQAFADFGFDVDEPSDLRSVQWDAYDVLLARNPHASGDLMKGIAARAAGHLPVIVDLDTAFEKLPPEHPDYHRCGTSRPTVSRSLRAALQLADQISVPGEASAEILRREGYSANVIPEGWSQYNFLWLKDAPSRGSFNIGLNVLPGQFEDVASIRRSIIRCMREFPYSRLVVTGDMEVYQMFDNLPDVRKLFLPAADANDYPFVLAQMDLLLAPARDMEFNHLRSDRILMEAGVRKIPWIGSPVHPYLVWQQGGYIAYQQDDWTHHLSMLIQDKDLRNQLGRAGFQKSQQREYRVLGRIWSTLISRVVTASINRS